MTPPLHDLRSLDPLFRPRSIAVLGASSDPAKIGGRPVRFLKKVGYKGRVFPVNPRYPEVQGLKSYASVRDIQEPVDLAVIAVPEAAVMQAVEDCAAKGVGAAIVFSSGFAETGGKGRDAQARMVDLARRAGMRLLGPNCMGVQNLVEPMCVTFGTSMELDSPGAGHIGFVSQSGAFGSVAYTEACKRGVGLTLWATTGNESDIDFADCIAYLAEDAATRVILGYMEGCRDGPKLVAALGAARRHGKPVVLMKVGSSAVGSAAAVSHTDSLTGSDEAFGALFRQYNVHRARSIDEFFDIGYACTAGRFPKGNRFGIVTVSGGVGILMADVAATRGLDVSRLPDSAQKKIEAMLPFAGTINPLDVTGQTLNQPDLLERALAVAIEEGGYDVLAVYLAGMTHLPALLDVAMDIFRRIRARYPDPLILLGVYVPAAERKELEELGYLVFDEPTRLVHAAAALVAFGKGFAAAERKPVPPLRAGRLIPTGPIGEHEATRILAEAGLPMAPARLADSARAAADAAAALGFPVVLKIASPDILHKTEIGGVLLDVPSAAAVRRGYAALLDRAKAAHPDARIDGVLVAPMIRGGVEAILGVKRDPILGPVVLCGLGGVFVEVLRDVALRLAPFDEAEALAMIRELKGYPLLQGVRGGKPADVKALAKAASHLSRFAAAHAGDIESIDLNPVLVLSKGQGAVALDALIVPRQA